MCNEIPKETTTVSFKVTLKNGSRRLLRLSSTLDGKESRAFFEKCIPYREHDLHDFGSYIKKSDGIRRHSIRCALCGGILIFQESDWMEILSHSVGM